MHTGESDVLQEEQIGWYLLDGAPSEADNNKSSFPCDTLQGVLDQPFAKSRQRIAED